MLVEESDAQASGSRSILHVGEPEGSKATVLTSVAHPASPLAAVFGPDGQQVYYVLGGDTGFSIVRQTPGSPAPQTAVELAAGLGGPCRIPPQRLSWSRGGDLVLRGSAACGTRLVALDLSRREVVCATRIFAHTCAADERENGASEQCTSELVLP